MSDVEVIAGELVGEDKHTVVIWERSKDKITKAKIRGRWLLVQKQVKPDQDNGIVLTELSRDAHAYSVVLAIGTGCGKYEKPTKLKKRQREWRPQVDLDINVMDTILSPDDHEWGIWRVNWAPNIFRIHECLAICAVEPETPHNGLT